jgi:beta-phosphoglucomutase-like phosphatase (HAD superfamily)
VVEDTAEGVKAARAAGMGVVGLSRAGAREDLLKAGADIAVASLDEVALDHLAAGKLRRIAISAGREVVAV